MFKQVEIAPSILSADFLEMKKEVEAVTNAGAGYIHIDVMDGHFVPNLTMGVPLVKQLATIATIPLDVHLMIANPVEQVPWYLEAGADLVTVHVESLSVPDLVKTIKTIKAAGAAAGVSVKPSTAIDSIAPVIEDVDMVLVMSVEPGFSGQSYIAGSEHRVAEVVEMARALGVAPLIQVDGGINAETAPLVAAAGADVLVCGNAVFGADDPAAALRSIKQAAEDARLGALAATGKA